MKNAIGYIRTRALTGQSFTHDAAAQEWQRMHQMQVIMDYAHANDYKIVDWKIDNGKGVYDDRPALNEIVFGEVHDVDAVIVSSMDRLARSESGYNAISERLKKKNVKLLFCDATS